MTGPPPAFHPDMFPDTVSVAVSGYSSGLHAGPSPTPGTPVSLACCVEPSGARDLPGTTAGQPMDVSDYKVIFTDPGTGSPPAPIGKNDILTWTHHYGVAKVPPVVTTVNAEWIQHDTSWEIGCKQQGVVEEAVE